MSVRSLSRHLAEREDAPARPQEVREIPIGMRRAAAWSWRILLVIALSVLVIWALAQLATIVIPVLIAILLATLLMPVVRLLADHTFLGRGVSAAIALVGLLLVVTGMFTLAGRQLFAQFGVIRDQAIAGFNQLTDWFTNSLQLDSTFIDDAVTELTTTLQNNVGTIASGALTGVTTVGTVLTGVVIALFTLFFLLSSGEGIWRWCVRLLPQPARVPLHEAVRRGWRALSAYMRTQILVAAVDATGISIGILSMGLVGYAIPVWLIVFLFSFVPLLGAIVSGAIAVLIVLVLKSWVLAIVMLGVVLAVQQIESNLLQPLLMGKAVSLHPLAVFLGVLVGTLLASIVGALLAIPLIAFVNATVLYLAGHDPSPEMGTDDVAAEAYASAPKPLRRA